MNAYFQTIFVAWALAVSSFAGAASADWWIDITNDRVKEIRTQLAMGEDPNAVSSEGQPSIMQAIQDGAWDVYDLLVQHRNLNVNAVNAHDETPLMYLSVVGETQRAAQLIKKGAEVNRLGWTPLHYAASKGHLDTVKLLIANKAMVNAPSPDGTSPLMMAAYAGSEPVVRALLDAGADVTARNLRKEDAADWARRKHHDRLAQQLDELTERVLGKQAPAQQSGRGTPQVDRDAPATAPSSQSGTQSSEDDGSTSRYFDLERFENDDNGY